MYSRAESGSTNGSPLVNSRRFLLNQNATIPNSLSEPDTLSLWNSCSIFKHSWIVTTQSNQEHLGASVRTKVHDYTEEMHRGHGLSLETFLSIQVQFSRNKLLMICAIYYSQLITGHFSICCVRLPLWMAQSKQEDSVLIAVALPKPDSRAGTAKSPGIQADLLNANRGIWYTCTVHGSVFI